MPESVVNVSNQLVWEVINPVNSFMKKSSKGPGRFTSAPFNPTGLHSYKYSGVANLNNVLTVEGKKDSYDVELVTSEKDAGNKPKNVVKTTTLKDASGPKRNNKKIIDAIEKGYYRRDLKCTLLKRYTKLYKAAQKTRKSRAK